MTRNGEAKVVLQDIDSFEKAQETIALFKIPALPLWAPAPICFFPAAVSRRARPRTTAGTGSLSTPGAVKVAQRQYQPNRVRLARKARLGAELLHVKTCRAYLLSPLFRDVAHCLVHGQGHGPN